MTDTGIEFDKVESDGIAQPAACAACNGALGEDYWVVNGVVACARCKESAATLGQGGSPTMRFVKALSFGFAGGAAGALVWYLVAHFTGYQLGLISILVGFLVGGGVRLGSERKGGWLYQLLAIGLSYVAIVAAWYPQVVEELGTGPEALAGLELYVVSIFAAFLAPLLSSIIGTLITLFALYEAWKMNKRPTFEITGPHRLASAATAPPLG